MEKANYIKYVVAEGGASDVAVKYRASVLGGDPDSMLNKVK
jgi:hypothetical protein